MSCLSIQCHPFELHDDIYASQLVVAFEFLKQKILCKIITISFDVISLVIKFAHSFKFIIIVGVYYQICLYTNIVSVFLSKIYKMY